MNSAADHEATVAARDAEMKVIAKAKKILEESSGAAASFLQVAVKSKMHTHTQLANTEVLAMIKKLASEHHSVALSQLASRISAAVRYGASAGEDPFAKVKSLVGDMIT